MDEQRPDAHLRDVDDGCGCTEIWEHTSRARAEPDAADEGEGRDEGEATDAADATDEADATDGS